MASDLGIPGNLDSEWDAFISRLIKEGIRLSDKEDTLVWSWDNVEGMVTVRKAYEVVTSHPTLPTQKWWFSLLWHWRLPPKLKVFGWLILENKLLTR